MRMMQFDQAANQVHMFSYSPYTDDINYYDTDLFADKDEFSAEMDLQPKRKRVATDYFECNVYTNELLGHKKHVKSGKTANWVWDGLQPDSVYYWYTVVKGRTTAKQYHRCGCSKREIRRIARLRISLISGMPQTHNENIQPADRQKKI